MGQLCTKLTQERILGHRYWYAKHLCNVIDYWHITSKTRHVDIQQMTSSDRPYVDALSKQYSHYPTMLSRIYP